MIGDRVELPFGNEDEDFEGYNDPRSAPFDDSEFADYGDEEWYDENEAYYYYDDDAAYGYEDDDYYYGEESYDSDDDPHPSYQSGFFKEGSPIGRFMADRNKDHRRQASKQ